MNEQVQNSGSQADSVQSGTPAQGESTFPVGAVAQQPSESNNTAVNQPLPGDREQLSTISVNAPLSPNAQPVDTQQSKVSTAKVTAGKVTAGNNNNVKDNSTSDTATPNPPATAPLPKPKEERNKPKSKKSASSWTLLGYDVAQWSRNHLFAIIVTSLFVVGNIARWIYRAIVHLNNSSNSLSTNLTSLMLKRREVLNGTRKQFVFSDPHLGKQLWNLASSMFFVSGVFALIINAALILLIISVAQSKLGIIKTVLVSVISAVIGTTLGLFLCVGVNMSLENWQWIQSIPVALSPLTLLIGALMASSMFQTLLWRRRILVIGYTAISAILLFSGNPGDYCALAAAVVGHIAGRLMRGKTTERAQWWRGTDYEIRRLFAAVQLVFAIGPLLAITSRTHAGALTGLGIFTSPDLGKNSMLNTCMGSHSTSSCLILAGVPHYAAFGFWIGTLITVAALSIVAWGLYRGKRLAAWTSIVINSTTVVFAVLYYLIFPLIIDADNNVLTGRYGFTPAFIATALPPLGLVILLARNVVHFPTRAPKTRVRVGAAALIITFFSLSGAYIALGLLFSSSFKPKASLARLIQELPHRLLPMGFAGRTSSTLNPNTIFTTVLTQAVGILFWICVLIVFLFWFQESRGTVGLGRERANLMVQQGGESMSFMTTWEGNQYWFSPNGRAAIAYRVIHGVALTLTGPFGDPNEYPSALREFSRFCDAQSWSPAFYAVHEEQRKILEEMGCSSIQVGTEMLVVPSQWQTKGKKWQDIRTAINKAKRDGVTDVLTTFDAAGWNIQQQIVNISEQWAELKALPEMKFTLGGVEELRDSRVALLYAIDSEGTVIGATSWLPTYRDGRVIGWTLDFMRHRTDSPNGVMEYLIARMAERLRDEGEADPQNAVEFMSLSAAPLAGLASGDQDRSAIIEHALQIVADTLEPAYGFKSLYFFKEKFQPIPSPIYICYPDSAKLAQIGLAVTTAYVPEIKPAQLVEMVKTLRPTDEKQ